MKRRDFLTLTSALLMAGHNRFTQAEPEGAQQSTQSIWHTAQKLHGLRLAKPGEQLQVIFFIDPNCPACAKLWQWFDTTPRRHLASGWVPVAYMKQTSAARSIALLRATDPYAALAKNYIAFDRATWQGGIPLAEDISAQERLKLRRNTTFWKSLFGATPLILYRTRNGEVWQQIGLPTEPRMNHLVTELAPATLEQFGNP